MICRYYRDTAKQNEVYEELVDIVEAGSETEDTEISDETSALTEYAELYEQNEDMVLYLGYSLLMKPMKATIVMRVM